MAAADWQRARAEALGRLGGVLDSLLEELERLQRQTPRTEEVRRSYERVRREARRYLWYLEVQREAVGAVDPREIARQYPIPGRLDRQEWAG